jgi:hypothetical protein
MPEQTKRVEQAVAVNVKLMPVGQSDQPVSANVSVVNVAQGIAYLDFGFIEPPVLASVALASRQGGKLPESMEGKLVVRVAMGLDALQRHEQQLQQLLQSLRSAGAAKT